MRRRFEGIRDQDLSSLKGMSGVVADGRVEILADFFVSRKGQGYLTGIWKGETRIDVITRECVSVGASLIWLHHKHGDGIVSDVVA
jgi:hypothetical protein